MAKRGKCKTVQESVKTEQFVKIDFSKIVTLCNSKNFELMKVTQLPGEDARKLAAQNDGLVIFGDFSRDVPETETGFQIPQIKLTLN